MSKPNLEESSASSDNSDTCNTSPQVDPTPTTYITLETTDGQLEHVKVHVNEEHFGTSAPILNYLAEQGEIRPTKYRGSGKRVTQPPKHHRPSETQNPAEHYDLDVRPRDKRSSSVMITPALIKDLKENRARIVSKGGQCNVNLTNVPKKGVQFFRDIFTTAVDMKWRYTMLAFFASFLLSWLFFGVVYYVIGTYRTDFEPEHLPSGEGQVNGTWKPCIWAVEDFTSCFLFSLETQHTIGYGSRQITEKCPEAIIVVAVQSVIGVIISCCMAGIVFAKLARPKCRTNTILFSNNAVITQRNGYLYLLFRVGNMRRSHLIETHVGAQLIHQKRTTSEGEAISFDMEELQLNTQSYFSRSKLEAEVEAEEEEEPSKDGFLLLWPVTVAHRIDASSPFYEMGPREILSSKFELVVTCEGINETNGNSVQARSSYLPNEILWGYRFNNMVSYTKESRFYQINFANLNDVKPDDTPRLSVRELDFRKKLNEQERYVVKNHKDPRMFTNSRSTHTLTHTNGSEIMEQLPPGGSTCNNLSKRVPFFTGSGQNSPTMNGPSRVQKVQGSSYTNLPVITLNDKGYKLKKENESEPPSSFL